MALAASVSTLSAVVRDIGRGVVFYSAGAYAGSGTDLTMTHLGDTEGDIEVELNPKFSELTLPELSGDVPHQAYIDGIAPVVKIPLYAAGIAVMDLVSPIGAANGGIDVRRAVTEYTLAIIPESAIVEAGVRAALGYTTAADWTVGGDTATAEQLALLDKSVWFWRGYFEPIAPKYMHADGGKAIMDVVFHAMHNIAMPDNHQVYTIGRPDQSSIELSSS